MTPSPFTSRLPGFYQLSLNDRVAKVAALCGLSVEESERLSENALALETADQMVENVIGTLGLPVGLGLNFLVNGRELLVPMAVEEPSVIAAVSFAARLAREGGGFVASADPSLMVAQVQVLDYGNPAEAKERLLAAKADLLAVANAVHPSLHRRGGGAVDLEVRVLDAPEGPAGEPILVLHVIIDTRDAMGANLVNTVAEALAPHVEAISGGTVGLRILSNFADRRLARAQCRIPVSALQTLDHSGEDVASGVLQASRFAQADPYRAATHNKGVMNGIDAVAIATGNDWRAIEAGAHAYACRGGRYGPLSTWTREGDCLVGHIELPLAVGTVGGTIKVHPHVQLMHRILGVRGARELAQVMASVGLAQNFAALRALGSMGIQKGHMAQHARCVALEAGARGEQVHRLAALLVAAGQVKVDRARELLGRLEVTREGTQDCTP